ncbi:MAG: hypothetical protein KAW12_27375 [Candidatus Aminicenantes bacterium]|nr:hypothetical protein [Candidatus Aminicenantes bacterium]
MDEKSKRLAEEAGKWVASPEGREAMKKAIIEAKESSKRFKESLQVDPKIMREPFTI